MIIQRYLNWVYWAMGIDNFIFILRIYKAGKPGVMLLKFYSHSGCSLAAVVDVLFGHGICFGGVEQSLQSLQRNELFDAMGDCDCDFIKDK